VDAGPRRTLLARCRRVAGKIQREPFTVRPACGTLSEINLGDPRVRFELGRWALGWLAPLVVVAGCSSPSGMLLADEPLARPKYAAWIAASAKRCGFVREQDAIKSAYLSFEARQGTSKEQLARLEDVYNLAWKSANDQGIDPGFCTQKKVEEIKLALGRHDVGDYTPNFIKTAVSAPRPRRDEAFDSKKFWDARDAERSPGNNN
jgi:hypothetical protein